MSDRTHNVTFSPAGISVKVPAGTTILAAANKAGVLINSMCGGDGVCGRCRVIVTGGLARGGSIEPFTREEIQRGYILACEARVESDLAVAVPPEAQLGGSARERLESDVPYLADLAKLIRYVRLAPLVRRTYLELPPPSLENNASDLQRLEHALARALPSRNETLQMGLKTTQRLPRVLRQADWKVTAVTGYRGALTEIIDVEAGDTSQRNFCVAADIGTTTIACQLVSLRDGLTIGQAGKYNSQAAYGADVIHRIIHASQGKDNEDALRLAVVADLNELIGQLVAQYRVAARDITLISAAGNTAMMHLLLGLPAENIRKQPYVGAAYELPPFRAAEIGLQISPRGLLYALPCIAGFIGSDTAAGIFTTGLAQGSKVRMLIDIGTNGEIAVGNREFLVAASASAGPAFEGAECAHGMRATRGALDHICLLDPDHILTCSVIGSGSPNRDESRVGVPSAPPVGICGTGYVDLVAEMLRVGLIDKAGKLQPEVCPSRVRTDADGQLEYVLFEAARTGNGKPLSVTQGDVNNILRAKAALYAAAAVLLHALNMTFDDVSEIMVAGGFGNFLNLENAIAIGLLPDVPPERLRFVGNTSLAGAKLAALSSTYYEQIARIARGTTYFELSTDPTFMEQFVSACFFPHTNVELFPSRLEKKGTDTLFPPQARQGLPGDEIRGPVEPLVRTRGK